MVESSASAKVILFGEHAVVYGQPAIAVPVSGLRAYAACQPNEPPGQGLIINAAGRCLVFSTEPALENPLVFTARLVLKVLDLPPPDVTITLRSDIPIASGLGSGAAVSTALARVLVKALNRSLDNESLNAIVYEIEKVHHGTPSGVDNTVVVYEESVYFLPGLPIERLTIGRPMSLLIANTGLPASTRVAVNAVRALFDATPQQIQPVINAIGELVAEARRAIEQGDITRLGNLMQYNHALLQQLTVSSPELDKLVQASLSAGAVGAKMSGGGRGGNMIALVAPETSIQVKKALLQNGAVSVFATTVQ